MSTPPIDKILELAASEFGEQLTVGEASFGTAEITVQKDALIQVVEFMRERGVDVLIDITGVHYPERTGEELMAVYHLQNMSSRERLRIKSYTPITQPTMPSLTALYAGANWMERETFDFFGIEFEGHPNLRRILNVDEMDYFPMRKEYPLEDQTREDKDDEMFGRKSLKDY